MADLNFPKPWEGDLPGVIGAGQQRRADQEHPEGGGPPLPPEPPRCFPPTTPEDWIKWTRFNLAHLFTDRYTRHLFRTYLHDTLDRRWVPAAPPPWIAPPPNALPISVIRTGDTTGSAGTFTTIGSVLVPEGMYGVVRLVGHDTQNDVAGVGGTDWASLTWRFALLSGTSATQAIGYGADYGSFARQIGQIHSPTSVFLFIPEGYRLAFQAADVGVAITGLAVVMHGWMWEVNQSGQQHQSADHIAGIQR